MPYFLHVNYLVVVTLINYSVFLIAQRIINFHLLPLSST